MQFDDQVNDDVKNEDQPLFPLERLNDELLIVVFERLTESSPHSLRACSGVNHRFYKLAVPIIWRHRVHLCNFDTHVTTRRLLNKGSQIPLFVRSLLLDDRNSNGSNDAEPFVEAIQACRNVKRIEIYGSYQFSQNALNKINKLLPTAKIHYDAEFPREEDGWYQGWSKGPRDGGMNGFSSLQLHSLRIDGIWAVDDEGHPVVQRSLERIIKSCSNLRHFTTYSADGYGVWNGVKQELELNISLEDRLPHLETFQFIPLTPKTLQNWSEIAGWQSLRVLKLGRLDLLHIFNSSGLPNLRSLTLSTGDVFSLFDPDTLDNLPIFRAPLQFLALEYLSGTRLPHRFLSQFSDTLKELLIICSRGRYGPGCPLSELRRLRESCPSITSLCIRPYIGETPKLLPIYGLDELAHFPNLQSLIISLPNQDGPLSPSSALCVEAYNSFHSFSWSPKSPLKHFGLIYQVEDVKSDSFDELLLLTRFLCTRTDVGVEVKKGSSRYWDHGNLNKCTREAQSRGFIGRPFSQKYGDPFMSYPEDIFWCAKQLGPGPSWAEKELLPKGLMRKEHLENNRTPSFINFQDAIEKAVRNEESLEEHRRLVKGELEYWKRRWELQDKYGKHYTLYDVLYPAHEY